MRLHALAAPLALLVLAGCGGGSENSPGSPEPAANENVTETTEAAETTDPTGLQVSGNFAADLTKYTGIVPDDAEDFRNYIAEGICESDIDRDAVGPAAFSVMVKRYGEDDPDAGTHPDLVRLVVEYDCPDRAELAEEYLAD